GAGGDVLLGAYSASRSPCWQAAELRFSICRRCVLETCTAGAPPFGSRPAVSTLAGLDTPSTREPLNDHATNQIGASAALLPPRGQLQPGIGHPGVPVLFPPAPQEPAAVPAALLDRSDRSAAGPRPRRG